MNGFFATVGGLIARRITSCPLSRGEPLLEADALRRENDRVRHIWERQAPGYDRQMDFIEKYLFAGGRQWVCAPAKGDVLELAVGTGRNLPFYRPEARLTGIDLSPAMIEIARIRAQELGRAVDLRLGDAQALDLPDASFDVVVITLSLCSIPDPRRAIAEARRVLRPGGQIRLLEHVRSPSRIVRAGERVLDIVMVRLEGDHYLREPLDDLHAEGFQIVQVERSKWGIVERAAARKP